MYMWNSQQIKLMIISKALSTICFLTILGPGCSKPVKITQG